MDMTCPACGSGNIKKLSDLWDEIRSGTPTSMDQLEAEIAGRLRGAAGRQGQSREMVRSLLLRELAPPQKRADLPVGGSCLQMSVGILMILVGFGAVVKASLRLAASHLDFRAIVFVVLSGLAVATVGYMVGRIGFPKATYREYGERLLAWQCTFRCMQCGNHFAVDPES
jgi:hypothetical protein